MSNLVLGLDIGITSVGYGVIDIENKTFVDYGVRLFKEGTAANNEKRRGSRGRRRLLRRRTTRLLDMQKLLEENGLLTKSYHPMNNVYELRVKGLSGKLSNEELVAVILHLTKHRGSSIETAEDMDVSDDADGTKEVLASNSKLLKQGKYICEIQLDRLNSDKGVRGHGNNFKTEDYLKEASKILSNQDLSSELQEEILQIISRKRAYYEGPGSKKSPTPYGRWFYDENGQIVYEDLIERMKGKCSVFPEELRAPKLSVSAEIFNLLNDLNNLTVEGEKLDESQKKDILEIVSKEKGITPKKLAKYLHVSEDDIKGFRIDTKKKPILTEFKGYKEIKKIFDSCGVEISLKDYELLDTISEILTDQKGITERKEALSKLGLNEDVIEELSKSVKFKGNHSLSLKAIRILNATLLSSQMNQIQALYELELFDKYRVSHKGKKNIEADDSAILSPVAKRSINETIKVVNALRKRHGEFDSIVVEMTRDKNDKERKERIKAIQKALKTRNDHVDKFLSDSGMDPDKIKSKAKQKIRLYLEQNGKSAYTFQAIDLHRLITDDYYTEIDHIIPISISLDDSQSNKVLTTRMENQLKGNLTPIMAYKQGKFKGLGCSLEEYKSRIQQLHCSGRKKRNLLDERDITKYDVIQDFINRNLIDTSYACKTVLNTLSNYFKDNEINTKVHTINGKVTDKFRQQIQLPKDRDEDYLHHAIDALIVASVKKIKLLNEYLNKYTFENFYDELTGEIKEIPDKKAYLGKENNSFIAQLKNIYQESSQYYKGNVPLEKLNIKPIKISHKVDTKPNRQVADETIYSTRKTDKGEMIIGSIKDIYAHKDNDNKSIITNMIEGILNDNSNLLLKEKDFQTYQILRDVVMSDYELYKDSKDYYDKDKSGKLILKGENPLLRYYQEFGPIKKYSKKGNGPNIKSLKFYNKALGLHIDVSKNYSIKDKRIVLLQLKNYRTDFYRCSDGKIRFVTVKYKDIHYVAKKNKYILDIDWYNSEKDNKKIDKNASFICTCYEDDIIGIVKKNGSKLYFSENKEQRHNGLTPEIVKFTATDDDKAGTFKVRPVYKYISKAERPYATTLIDMKKYTTDVLGNLYEVKENKLKLEFE